MTQVYSVTRLSVVAAVPLESFTHTVYTLATE